MYFNFSDILGNLVCEIRGDINGEYHQVTRDSRKVEAGAIFTAVKGISFDGLQILGKLQTLQTGTIAEGFVFDGGDTVGDRHVNQVC